MDYILKVSWNERDKEDYLYLIRNVSTVLNIHPKIAAIHNFFPELFQNASCLVNPRTKAPLEIFYKNFVAWRAENLESLLKSGDTFFE